MGEGLGGGSGHTTASEKDPVYSPVLGADRVFCVSEATDRLIRPGPLRGPVFFELIGTKTGFARTVLNGGPRWKQPRLCGCRPTDWRRESQAGRRFTPDSIMGVGAKLSGEGVEVSGLVLCGIENFQGV